MIPSGVVKGGTAMKLRRGDDATRFTPDLDASRAADESVDEYIEAFAGRLSAGWNGFTGTIEATRRPEPPDVPDDYIMTPYLISLSYFGRHWLRVEFELGRDEVGSTLVAEPRMAADIVAIFREIGLPDPEPIPIMSVAHQVAQKLHACTSIDRKTGGNDRAHDLVDLQLLVVDPAFDAAQVASVARRLFESRRKQSWPPIVVAYPTWSTIYANESDGLDVAQGVETAVEWANALVASIDSQP